MEKFGKGPWYFIEHDGNVYDDFGNIVCDYYPTGEEREEANAHLIAAAPDMYEILKRLIGPYGMEDFSYEEVEELLSKARGEA